ncbi:hypothetical protein [Microbispora rosea]|uniref:hypothetical protein n=1 Tax=Microbispora rosea TaxID=58117 RepID=UPI0037A0776E
MPTTDQPYTPAGGCHGACNHRNRATWAAYQRAIEDHADAIDTWFRNGQHGEPPAEPDQPTIYWKPGNPLFCERDVAATRRSLLEIDTQAAQLAATSDGHRAPGRGGDGKVSGSKTSGSVSPAADILDRLLGDLFDTEDEWRHLRGYPARPTTPAGPRGAHARTRTISWLADHLTDILAHEDMTGLPRKVFNWERVLRHLSKDARASTSSPIRCPRPTCGERRITWDDEHHYYTCQACGQVIYEHEHDDHEREQAEAADLARLTAPLPPAVHHRVLVPARGDDHETRAAGSLPVVDPIRIDPDTLRLIFRAPYRRPLTEDEFPTLPWPACPGCGGTIDVDYVPVASLEDRGTTALPGRWRCAGAGERPACGAEGSA